MYIDVLKPEGLQGELVQLVVGEKRDIIFAYNVCGINLRIPHYNEDGTLIGTTDAKLLNIATKIIPTIGHAGAYFLDKSSDTEGFRGWRDFDVRGNRQLVGIVANRLMHNQILNIVDYHTYENNIIRDSSYRKRHAARVGAQEQVWLAVPILNTSGIVVGFKSNVEFDTLAEYTKYLSPVYKAVINPQQDDAKG
jgi:hypothetical protein